jgi:sulfite reductase (NADPH) hemoprotein beta-component
MDAIDDTRTLGRARLDFASEHDIDEFVETLRKFECGEMPADQWRRFRLVRGTYGQRQDGVQMLRVKAPQGVVTSSQMRAFAGVASRYSRGFCHITTRQNIQLHFVLLKNVEAAMRELADEGLTTREACGNSVRNITGCPYAGTSESEIFDPSPYAETLTRYFLRHPLSGVLPRKFKIAFEGCSDDHAYTSINDIGWRARIVDGRKGWKVTVAGGTSILPVSGYILYEFLPVEQMLEVAEAVVRVFHKYGDYQHPQRNRMKFVIRAIGWDAYRAHFEEELEAFRLEGGARLPFDAEKVAVEGAPDWEPAAPPTLQHVAALAATPMRGPGIHPGTVRLQPMSDAHLRWMRRNVTRQRQAGYCHVTVRLPLGDFTAGQMRVLADLADAYGDSTMRLTIEQNVLFRWVKTESLEPFYQRLAAAGLNSPDALSMSDVISCPGAESCRLAVTQSRGLGRVLTEYFSARPELVDLVPSGNIRISGCPNGCGQHHIGSLGFQGSVRKVGGKAVPQYFVLVGGGVTDEGAHFGKVVAKIPARRIAEAAGRLVDLYREQRESNTEDLGAFYRRIQPSIAADRLKDLVELNANATTPDDFIDLGESQAFDPVVMDGECSA